MLILAAMAVSMSACGATDPKEISNCEAALKSDLKAPSTYKRISAASDRFTNRKGVPYQSVAIEYDAANAYGTPIRETTLCAYPITAGEIREDLYYDARRLVRDAQLGRGMFKPGVKLPSRAAFMDAMVKDQHRQLIAPYEPEELSTEEVLRLYEEQDPAP